MDADNTLHIAEEFYETGEIRFRYARVPSADGRSWVKEGLFRGYHRNGGVSTEGEYVAGVEQGVWRDFHENGRLAATGKYVDGKEHGIWKFYGEDGVLEQKCKYRHGVEIDGVG